MRTQFPVPNGVVSLIPLHLGYAFEVDGDDDIIGVVLSTALGEFAMWLPAESAVALAGHLVQIVENRETLRERYAERAEAGLSERRRCCAPD